MTISILGCGWLGFPLAEQLAKTGNRVNGSTTSSQKLALLSEKNITPFLMKFNPKLQCKDCDDFWNADLLVVNIPSRIKDMPDEFHLRQVEEVVKRLNDSTISRVIFVSSTSVYPPKCGIVGEGDTEAGKAIRESGNILLKAEKLLLSQKNFETTVIRFGGLYGYDRHPAKYLAGRTNLKRGNAPINLIHRDDCLNIIQKIIDENVTGEIFNGVSDGHPPRKMYYPAAAQALGLESPTFEEDDEKDYKIVSNHKLKEELKYEFKYPNPIDFESC